jgi:uncharacterized SAM-binding protein YcdF (DUF218 family)
VSRLPLRRLALIVPLLLLAAASPWLLPWAGNFLVAQEGPPRKADAALVLAGDAFGRRILRGAEMVREGHVPLVYVSGPHELYGFSEDELAIQFAVKKGLPAAWFQGLPNQANSTDEEARSLLPELQRRGVKRLLLVTSNYHTRRATRIFRRIAAERGILIEIHPVAARDALFEPSTWWHSRPAQKIFLLEWTKTLTEPFGI